MKIDVLFSLVSVVVICCGFLNYSDSRKNGIGGMRFVYMMSDMRFVCLIFFVMILLKVYIVVE